MRLIQKYFYYVLGLMTGHLSDLAHACIAGVLHHSVFWVTGTNILQCDLSVGNILF